MEILRVSFFCLILILGSSFVVESQNSVIRPIILDIDGDISDFGALIYLLNAPNIEIKAITISPGINYIKDGINNVLKVLDHLQARDIPVAGGSNNPLEGDHQFPSDWRDTDNFFGVGLEESSRVPSEMNASALIIDLLEEYEEIEVVAVGPLTNIARVIQKRGDLLERISNIYMMGGALGVEGNVGRFTDIDNVVSEWNFYIDPLATKLVFDSGIPLWLVPLDATNQVPTTTDFEDKLNRVKETDSAELYAKIYTPNLYFWDELTAVSMKFGKVIDWEEYTLDIIVDDLGSEGRVFESNEGSIINVATKVDKEKFENEFLSVINNGATSAGYISIQWSMTLVSVILIISIRRHNLDS